MVVFAAADQDSDRLAVRFALELIVDHSDIEIQLPSIFGLEFTGFEFDDEVAQLLDMEEQQIDIVIVPADFDVDLSTDERETRSQLTKGLDDPVGQRLFNVPLGDLAG